MGIIKWLVGVHEATHAEAEAQREAAAQARALRGHTAQRQKDRLR